MRYDDIIIEHGNLVLWHVTSEEAASAILDQGFRDHTGCLHDAHGDDGRLDLQLAAGAWHRLQGHDRPQTGLDERDLGDWEVVDLSGEATYREWCAPAELLNRVGTIRMAADEEIPVVDFTLH